MDSLDDAGAVQLGSGLMTLSSVMGTAFIRAYRLNGDTQPGPFLTVAEQGRSRLPANLPVRVATSRKSACLLSIDWIRADMPLVGSIQERATLEALHPDRLEMIISEYCHNYPDVQKKGQNNLCEYLNINSNK